MHRDEQSAWQAGSYSFLTPDSAEWCNRTAGPLPFLLPCFALPLSFLFPSPFSPQLSFYLPSIPFPTHSLSSLFPFLSQSPLLSLLLFTCSLSISLLSRSHVSMLALHTITSIHQLSAYSSLATPLPFLYPMTTTPHYPAYTCFFATPISHLPARGAAECTSRRTRPPSPSSPFSPLKAQPHPLTPDVP